MYGQREDKKVDREKRNIKVQVRITPKEKSMIDVLRKVDNEFSVSRLFRKSLQDYYNKNGINREGLDNFIVN